MGKELCTKCWTEFKANKWELQKCPNCGAVVRPCNLCSRETHMCLGRCVLE